MWSGNRNTNDSFYTRPANDRLLFDLFTTAFNDNATRGQLPVNQTGLAAWSAVFGSLVAITNTSTDTELQSIPPVVQFSPLVVPPAGVYDPVNTNAWPAIVKIVNGINTTRNNTNLFPNKSFEQLGDVLAVPELTAASPLLNTSTDPQKQRGLNDAAYEWLPQQIMSLLRKGEPRFVVYAYGQSLMPAPESIVGSGLCTNYQITAEVAARAVVRVEGSPDPKDNNNPDPKRKYPPRLVIESYNLLGPE